MVDFHARQGQVETALQWIEGIKEAGEALAKLLEVGMSDFGAELLGDMIIETY